MTTTKRQTAGNNALLKKIKRVFNSKIYRASLGVMNSLGEEACIAYVQQFVRPPILPHLDALIDDMDAYAAKKQAASAESVLRYTTAPEAYDGFGTETIEADAGRDDRGRTIRLVSIRREHLNWQESRYESGPYVSVTPDEVGRFRSIWTLDES